MAAQDPRVVGGRYCSGYWRQEYVVLAQDARTGALLLAWQDGKRTWSLTSWDSAQDSVVGEGE